MNKPLNTGTLQARDLIYQVLKHRLNLTLTETVARDAANNAACALIPLLEDLQRGTVAAGEIEVTDEPPPVRDVAQCQQCSAPLTMKIPLDGDAPVLCFACRTGFALSLRMPCTRTKWCGDFEGHEGECIPPF